MGNTLPKTLPKGLIYKRYSWRAQGEYTHIILRANKGADNSDSICYQELVPSKDEFNIFTNTEHHRIQEGFNKEEYRFLSQQEFCDFIDKNPNIMGRLKEEGIEKLVQSV